MSKHSRSAIFAIAALSSFLEAQSPRGPWHTLRTPHYRIHYLQRPEFVAFAREVASRVEDVHKVLEQWVGHNFPGSTDIIIENPMQSANGVAFPHLHHPAIVLWTESPKSDSTTGHHENWIELLLIHEFVHLHHLTWRATDPQLQDRISQWLGIGPLVRKAPQWVIEGYATLLEGRLSGSGRPHGAYRALTLRRKASEGRLPAYEALNEDSTPYLFGSAFMEWLAQNQKGDNAIRNVFQQLWRHLASSHCQDFDQAFLATFGEKAKEAYGRFCAHLTHSAVEHEKRTTAAGLREGLIWSRLENGRLSDLSMSPDSNHLLAMARIKGKNSLLVWDLKEKTKKEGKTKAPLPDAVPPRYPVKAASHQLHSLRFSTPSRPRWDEKGSIRFQILVPDAEGVYQHQEATWAEARWKKAERKGGPLDIVHLTPEKTPSGRWTVNADQKQFRGDRLDALDDSKIINVSEDARPTSPLTPAKKASKACLFDHGVNCGMDRKLELPFEPFGQLAWDKKRGIIYASAILHGVPEIIRFSQDFDPSTFAPEQLTRVLGAAAYPVPSPDGKQLFFIHMTDLGSEIRRLDLTQAPDSLPPVPQEEQPLTQGAIIPSQDQPSLLAPRTKPSISMAESQPYSALDSHRFFLPIGFLLGNGARTLLLGVGGNDLLGRASWLLLGAADSLHGSPGFAGAFAWRGWLWSPSGHVFSLKSPAAGKKQDMRGLELALSREWLNHPFAGAARLALAAETQKTKTGLTIRQQCSTGSLSQMAGWERNRASLRVSTHLSAQLGRSEIQGEDANWSLLRGGLALRLGYQGVALRMLAELGDIHGDTEARPSPTLQFVLGGQNSGLLPDSVESRHIFQAGLPAEYHRGRHLRRWKADCHGFYFESCTLKDGKTRHSTRVTGYAAAWKPDIKDHLHFYIGRPEITLGLHRILDAPSGSRDSVTLAMIYRY